MNEYNSKPEGLETITDRIEMICAAPDAYRKGKKPPHFIINLDKTAQSDLTTWITDVFEKKKIIPFSNNMDTFLEFILDGSKKQLHEDVFDEIHNSRGFKNHYEGIIAMDITEMADHVNEPFYEKDFTTPLSKVAEHAQVVIYVTTDFQSQPKMVLAVEKVRSCLGNNTEMILVEPVKDLDTSPGNTREACNLSDRKGVK